MARNLVAHISDLTPGQTTVVDLDGEEVLLVRIKDKVYAINNLCSHAEGWLDMGQLFESSCEIGCPLHDGRFDLRTGQATHEPATEPVPVYRVEVEDGDIFLVEGAPDPATASVRAS
ncbi:MULTISPECIES: non-heme iron oxygenase ferredoxin subunit [unclassified Nocardioides]|uniref:non-heme iron oxygenase ferredoxin subunit n=1 Tax=unclassified Nocardioides TaxID=2615069 RepID=UPI0000571A3C|nr:MULTISPECIES: non-heme iron oxygenase ferredoxin subunit [unclassified Nocardioides]ABL81644.1 Rieske (2Fe-2S) domain protein [Nocardioides sp. JS614]